MIKFLLGFILGGIAGIFLMCLLQINKGKERSKQMINVFPTIKCENCGKEIDKLETQYIRLGKAKFKVCLECKEICEKFKQRNDV